MCVYVYIYIYIHAYMHICIYAYSSCAAAAASVEATVKAYSEGQQVGNNFYNPMFIASHGKSWYEAHAAQNLGMREQSYSKHVVAISVCPTCCASLPSSVKHEMFGNRIEFGFSGDVFAPSI